MSISFKPFVRILPTPATVESSLAAELDEPPTFLVHADSAEKIGVELVPDFDLKLRVHSDPVDLRQASFPGSNSIVFFAGHWTAPWSDWQELIKTSKRIYFHGRARDSFTAQNEYNFLLTPYGRRSLDGKYQDELAVKKTSTRLSRLTIKADKLLQDGNPVTLRGVNLSGLQHRDPFRVKELGKGERREWGKANGFTRELIARLQKEGVGIVRILLNQQYVLDDVGLGPKKGQKDIAGYLSSLDSLIDWCTDLGIYTLLCLHSLAFIRHDSVSDCYNSVANKNIFDSDPDFGTLAMVQSEPFTPPMPDAMSPFFWSILAERYGGHSGVLLDLLNEPRRPTDKEDTPKNGSKGVAEPKTAGDKQPKKRQARYDEGYFFPWKKRRSLDDRYYKLDKIPTVADRPIPANDEQTFWIEEWHQWVRYFDTLIRGSRDIKLGWGSPPGLTVVPERASETLLFVAGIYGENWSADLGSMPVRTESSGAIPLKGIVYKPHFYQQTSGARMEGNLKLFSGGVAPIFIGEWGTWTKDSMLLRDKFPSTNSEENKNFITCNQAGNLGVLGSKAADKPEDFLGWAKVLLGRAEARPALQALPESQDDAKDKKETKNVVSGWTAWSVGDWPDILVKKDERWIRSFDPFLKTDSMGTWVFSALKFKFGNVELMVAGASVSSVSDVFDITAKSEFDIVAEVCNGLGVRAPAVKVALEIEDQFRSVMTITQPPVSGFIDDRVRAKLKASRATKDVIAERDYCVLTLTLEGVAFAKAGDGVHKVSIRVK